MKIAITGSNGLLGHGLAKVFSARHTVFPFTHSDCDITNAEMVRTAFARVRPDAVIHAAAIPDPDVCEADPPKAHLVNVEGTRNVVAAASVMGATVAFISTDAVFNGEKQTPYVESDPTGPPSVYGRTKLLGENIVRDLPQHWVFRVSVLFGPGKTNFVEKGLRKLAAGEDYLVASDQIACAAYTLDVAHKIMELMEAQRFGIFHIANEGACSRLELARQSATFAGLDDSQIIGKPMDQLGRLAKRLKYSVMEMAGLKQAGIAPLRPWQAALEEYVREWHSKTP